MIRQIVGASWNKRDGGNVVDALNNLLNTGEGWVDITGQPTTDIDVRVTGQKNLALFEMQVDALKSDPAILHVYYIEEDEEGNQIATDQLDSLTQQEKNAIRQFTNNLGFNLQSVDTREELFRELMEAVKERQDV